MELKENTRKEKILELMKQKTYKPMTAKNIAVFMEVPKKEYMIFFKIINELEEEFKILKIKGDKYKISKKKYIEGVYRKNQKGFGFVKPISENTENRNNKEEVEEIYISKKDSLNALNGDIVIVQPDKEIKMFGNNKEKKRLEGKVVKILKHEKDEVVGLFKQNEKFGFVVPDDKSFGTDIFIPKRNFGKARDNHKVVVKIEKYPSKGKNAEGRIIEVLGGVNQAGIDMLSLIKEHKLPSTFPDKVVEEAKKWGNRIDKKDIPNRVDFRDDKIFTIDGEDAKDLDDAIKVEKLENGNYRLDVHIADVSYYVMENTELDKEAYIRGTSVYMLGRVVPMLPRELSNGICSLNENVDRFTLSCLMEIDNKGNLLSSQIVKGIINVTKRMTYTNVQKILDGKDKKILNEYKEYIEEFKQMEELALILKNKRLGQGYLNLDIPESKVELDSEGRAINVKKYESTFANEIIEQFMLKANEAVAEKFFWLEAPFIYRVHETPDLEKISELNKFLASFKMKIKANKETVHPKEFAKILGEIKGKEEQKVISTLILRTLKVARYEAENKGHFGIASKYYSHFTSPIRRYPDLYIHRIISKYIQSNYDMPTKWVEKQFGIAEKAAEQSSAREKIATKIEREAIDMKKAEYMQDKIGKEYEGIVSSVTPFGMFVELENTVEGLIRFEDLGNEYYIYDENKKQLIGENTNKVYKIGDKVNIKVKRASKELRQIDFALI